MQKKNQELINKGLRSLLSRLEKTEKFVLAQAPEICQQMIREVYIDEVLNLLGELLLFMLITALMIWSYYRGAATVSACLPTQYDKCSSWSDWWIFSIVLTGLLLVPIALIGNSLAALLFVIKCPKLFLLRSFRRLIR
jgi:hypothetical protein